MSIWDYLSLIQWIQKLWGWALTWQFRRVFGNDVNEEYHIIYKINEVPVIYKSNEVSGKRIIFPTHTPKFPRKRYCSTTNLTTINSYATTRAVGHLVYAFGKKAHKPPVISSTVDTDEKMDISFISIGGTTNLKTCDLLEDVSYFLDFKGNSIIQGNSQLITATNDIDGGFIIKIHPQSNPERTWLCCAGLGEWGTSGAAWFLSRKWKDIHKWAKSKSFAIITKTTIGSDESTRLVHRFLRNNKTGEFNMLE